MEEKKLFQEGNIAITTHRIVWGDDVIDYTDVKNYLGRPPDDVWMPIIGFSIVGAIGMMIMATWSIIVGLICFGIAFMIWKTREYKVLLEFDNGNERTLTTKSDGSLYQKVVDALKKSQDMWQSDYQKRKQGKAGATLAEIDQLSGD